MALTPRFHAPALSSSTPYLAALSAVVESLGTEGVERISRYLARCSPRATASIRVWVRRERPDRYHGASLTQGTPCSGPLECNAARVQEYCIAWKLFLQMDSVGNRRIDDWSASASRAPRLLGLSPRCNTRWRRPKLVIQNEGQYHGQYHERRGCTSQRDITNVFACGGTRVPSGVFERGVEG